MYNLLNCESCKVLPELVNKVSALKSTDAMLTTLIICLTVIILAIIIVYAYKASKTLKKSFEKELIEKECEKEKEKRRWDNEQKELDIQQNEKKQLLNFCYEMTKQEIKNDTIPKNIREECWIIIKKLNNINLSQENNIIENSSKKKNHEA